MSISTTKIANRDLVATYFVSFHSIPSTNTRAIQFAKFTNLFFNVGHLVSTTASPDGSIPQGMRDNTEVFNRVHLFKINEFNQKLAFYKTFKKMTAWLPTTTPENFCWSIKVFYHFLFRTRHARPRVIWSFSTPLITHLITIVVSKIFSCQVVCFFSDPWTLNPYFKFDSRLKRILNFMLEKWVLKNADLLLYTNEEIRTETLKRFPSISREKTVVLPHAYLSNKISPKVPLKGTKLTFRYFGQFYGERTPLPLFNALSKLPPELTLDVVFEFYGKQFIWNRSLLKSALSLPDGLIKISGHLDNDDALKLMETSDCLLVIDAPYSPSPFFPSKLADYLGTNVPILAITPLLGVSARITQLAGGLVGSIDSDESIQNSLIQMLTRLKNGVFCLSPNEIDYRRKFSNENRIELIEKIIDRISPTSTIQVGPKAATSTNLLIRHS